MPLVRECTMFLEDRYIKIFKKNCDFLKLKYSCCTILYVTDILKIFNIVIYTRFSLLLK